METTQRANAIDPGLVRMKAYELWQLAGCPVGAAEQHWLEAEQQLRAARADVARESARTVSIVEPISTPTSELPSSRSDVPPSNPSNSKAKKRTARR